MPNALTIAAELAQYEEEKQTLETLLADRIHDASIRIMVKDSCGRLHSVNLECLPLYPFAVSSQAKELLSKAIAKYEELIEDIQAITNL